MTSNDIYSILTSKVHNIHYLKRYLKFISVCQGSEEVSGYKEIHHICPKASDLFPEYTDLKINQWNAIKLSARQHFVAHYLLWKVYGGSQSYAFKRFCDGSSTEKVKREKKYRVSSRTYEILKMASLSYTSERMTGTVIYKNTETGETGWISKEEFDSNDLLVGLNAGTSTYKNTETGESGRISKEEFDSNDLLVGLTAGTVTYKNTKTGESGRISKEEFDSNDLLVGASTDRIPAMNRITKEKFTVTKEEFDSNDLLVGIQYLTRGWKNSEEGCKNKSKPKSKEHAAKIANAIRSRVPVVCCIFTRKEFICSAWISYEKMTYEPGYRDKLSQTVSAALRGIPKTQKHKDALKLAKSEKNKINRICVLETKVEMTTSSFIRNETMKKKKEQSLTQVKSATVPSSY